MVSKLDETLLDLRSTSSTPAELCTAVTTPSLDSVYGYDWSHPELALAKVVRTVVCPKPFGVDSATSTNPNNCTPPLAYHSRLRGSRASVYHFVNHVSERFSVRSLVSTIRAKPIYRYVDGNDFFISDWYSINVCHALQRATSSGSVVR